MIERIASDARAGADARSARPLHVALVGFGTVGSAVARILTETAPAGLRLTDIYNRGVARKRAAWVPDTVRWTERIEDVLRGEADVIVELVGGVAPARAWIAEALGAGKSVVTANKLVIAEHGADLLALADTNGVSLRFEGAVAGGVPVVHGLQVGIAGDHLQAVTGIVNGTCNYILSSMDAGGASFDEALAAARELGFAEADASSDIDGIDARAKLAILAWLGLGQRVLPGQISSTSIAPIEAIDFAYARRLHTTIRQVAEARIEDGRLVARVSPALVPESSPLARVAGSQNLVITDGRYGGRVGFFGAGAGGAPTAVAVVSDLLALARGDAGARPATREAMPLAPSFTAPHYLRFRVVDRRGIVAALAGALADHGINIDAVLQEPGWPADALPFVITTEACSSADVGRALEAMARFDFHRQRPLCLPMLDRR